MSKIISGQATTDMQIKTLSKNANNVSAYKIQCICGKSLGTPGQLKPLADGRRIVMCDQLTPEQTAAIIRKQGGIIHPTLFRQSKGCGSITVLSPTMQVEKVIQANEPAYKPLKERLDLVKKQQEEKAAFEALVRRQEIAEAQRRGGGKR